MFSEQQIRRAIREELRVILTKERLVLGEKKWRDFNAPKGVFIDLTPQDFDDDDPEGVRDLDDEIFDLVRIAYNDVPLGGGKFGNVKIQSPSDLPGAYTMMKAVDIDADPEPDVFRGGKIRNGRYKLGVVGHDGSRAAVQSYLQDTADALRAGAIAEMSGKIATIMITRHGIPAITDQAQVEALLGKKVSWVGRHPQEKWAERYGPGYEGWYTRGISGAVPGDHIKILMGDA